MYAFIHTEIDTIVGLAKMDSLKFVIAVNNMGIKTIQKFKKLDKDEQQSVIDQMKNHDMTGKYKIQFMLYLRQYYIVFYTCTFVHCTLV